ncbi:MAG: hypothetical protein IT483_04595 [Gammaproteobacteria bacterium]|nr:hypothetical protein [Gammaproteobacteria bacterium]
MNLPHFQKEREYSSALRTAQQGSWLPFQYLGSWVDGGFSDDAIVMEALFYSKQNQIVTILDSHQAGIGATWFAKTAAAKSNVSVKINLTRRAWR